MAPGLVALWAEVDAASAVDTARQAREAVAAFLGHALSPGELSSTAQLPGSGQLVATLHPLALGRVLDALVLVAIAVGLVGVGKLLRARALPSLRPAVFASGVLAVTLYSAVNPAFWRAAAVRVDRDGVTLVRYAASDRHLAWRDVRSVSVVPGAPLPVFVDDRALRLTGCDGTHLDIPRFLSGVERVAAALPTLLSASQRAQEAPAHAPVPR